MGETLSESDERSQLDLLRKSNERLYRKLTQAKLQAKDFTDAVYRAAFDAASLVGMPTPIQGPPSDLRADAQHCLVHLTDWQIGKKTDDYNTEVAKHRIRDVVQQTMRLANINRYDHPVPVCHILFGGDLVENLGIFPGQAYEVDGSAFYQVFAASSLMEEVILSLLGTFNRVEVWEVSGNHGRIGKEGDHPREDNFDRIVGRIARERLRGHQRLFWHEPKGWYSLVEAGAYRALLVHGDQIRTANATTILKKVNAWASGVVEPFTDIYLGHMHQAMQLTMANGGTIYMTPSTESGSAYAEEFMAAKGKPAQRVHFIDPQRAQVTGSHLIWL